MAVVTHIVDLELTNACPADCLMCPRDRFPSLGIMKDAVFERVTRDLAAASSLRWVSLCGIGEPLLHPKVVEWSGQLARLPSLPSIGIVTAGERLAPDLYHALADAGVTQIEVSVQAVDRTLYETLMPGLRFERVMANLEYVAAHPRPGLGLAISYTEHLANREHTPEVGRAAARLGVRLDVTRIHSRAGNLVDSRLLVAGRPAETRACRIFEKIAFIAWDGRVQYCCHDVERAHVAGDLGVEELAAVNARKTDLIREHGGPPAPICARCDDPLRETL